MATYVLVHGGWHGGWCWSDVARDLRALGHDVYCPTLTGLGERKHLIDHVTGPETHVRDIVNVILANDLDEVILVGHSYAGMIITGAAVEVQDRISHLIYLDAFVPTKNGESAMDLFTPERREQMAAGTDAKGQVAAHGFDRWSEDPEKRKWLQRMTTPHPLVCYAKGLASVVDPSTLDLKRSYILCSRQNPSAFTQFYTLYRDDPRWSSYEMDCLHDAMVDRPAELTAILTGQKK